MTILLTNLFLHSIHTLLKQYSGSIQGNASLLTLATPWVHLGYTLGRVCEIRHKSIKNPSNRKRKIDISTDEHIRNYQNWLIVARASRVTHRRSQEPIQEYIEKENKYKTVYQQDRPLCFDYQMIHERFDICLDSIVGDQPVEKETNAEEEALPF